MQTIKKSKRSNLSESLDISNRLRETSEEISNMVNFIQLNELALEQTLNNIDQEFHAFESKIFKQFFEKFYNQKYSHLKHFTEHPGTLKASYQVEYLRTLVDQGLKNTLANKDYSLPRTSAKNPSDGFPRLSNKKIDKRMMFSHKHEMDELSGFRPQPVLVNPMGFETNEIEMQDLEQSVEELDVDSVLNRINLNLKKVEDAFKIQYHFFSIHESTMFQHLNIKSKSYLEDEKLKENAYINYADTNLSKEKFIFVALNNDNKRNNTGEKACYSMFDLFLVYLHTFLYIMNYYGLAQTSPDYTEALGIEKTLSGIVQAATPGAALFFGFFINCITKRKYKCPYILCLFMLVVGNFLYFISLSVYVENKDLAIGLLIAGRMIFGCGGSRLMTRKFIAINIPSQFQSSYSNWLVGISALGITLGPGISSCLEYINNTSFYIDTFKISITKFNIFSLGFFGIWFLLFFVFLFCFKGYDSSVDNSEEKLKEQERRLQDNFLSLNNYYKGLEDKTMYTNLEMVEKKKENFITSGLIVNPVSTVSKQNEENPNGYNIVVPDNIRQGKTSRPFYEVYFPNDITWFSLWCFLVFKIIQEAFITELPQMFEEYYGHNSQIVGWFLLSLTAVGVPTALLTGAATRKYKDRNILLFGFIIYILACAGKINYEFDAKQPFEQYIVASAFLFIGSLITEAAAISILAKLISPSLKLGFFNAGLLAGTADTIGRALGNASMTLFSDFR